MFQTTNQINFPLELVVHFPLPQTDPPTQALSATPLAISGGMRRPVTCLGVMWHRAQIWLSKPWKISWIAGFNGLVGKLWPETRVFFPSNLGFSCKMSLKAIHCMLFFSGILGTRSILKIRHTWPLPTRKWSKCKGGKWPHKEIKLAIFDPCGYKLPSISNDRMLWCRHFWRQRKLKGRISCGDQA